MKNYKKLLILLVIILGIVGLFIFVSHSQKSSSPNKEILQELKSTLSIDIDSKTSTFNIADFAGKTALEATQANATIVMSGSGVNAFITSINGRAADSKKHEFWQLDINGSGAQVGAGSYIIQKGDSILWHINTY